MNITWQSALLGIFYISTLLYMINPTKRALHMFQQNRYEIKRYLPWLSKAVTDFSAKSILYLVALFPFFAILFLQEERYRWIALIAITWFYTFAQWINEKRRTYIKPLNITFRVRRQMFVMSILVGVMLYLFLQFFPFESWLIITPALYWLPWVLIVVMAFITEPLETFVKKTYIFRAKRILKRLNNLIKIGITGSYGKTSSKNILHEILSSQFYTLMTPASYNTPMGITITIRELLKPLHQVFICEMGADKVGEINYLTKFVQPQFGIVTSIGPQHLNTFKTIENIISEKMMMIENLPLSGVGVLNRDNEHIANYRIKNKCQIIWYGIESQDVDYRAVNIRYTTKGTFFDIMTREQVVIPFETKLLGEHNILNILAAVALGKQLGIDWQRLQKAVAMTRHVEHRLEVKKMGGYTIIDNAFNSNPVSAKNSLEVLKMMPGRRIIITPGMIELGDQEDYHNHKFGTQMIGHADEVILVGKTQTAAIVDGLKQSGFDMGCVHVVTSIKEAFAWVYKNASTSDTILLENDLPDAFSR